MLDVDFTHPNNRWTLIGPGSRKGYVKVQCSCPDKTIKEIYVYDINKGKSLSCGCLRKEVMSETKRTHGMSKTAIYNTWCLIIRRTENEDDLRWEDYGARGIKMCAKWRESFEAFYADMGDPPSDEYTINRIDNDGNYEPGNCHWATDSEQQNNKRNNRLIEWNGRTQTMVQWERELGFREGTLKNRLDQNNWTVERAMTTPVRTKKKITYNGKTQAIDEWAEEYGLTPAMLRSRLNLGIPFETAIATPAYHWKGRGNPIPREAEEGESCHKK
jgi:hypothetical protein